MHVAAVEIEDIGVCIRYAPMESSQSQCSLFVHADVCTCHGSAVFDTTKEDLEKLLGSLASQLKILDATVKQRSDFHEIVTSQDNLRLVTLPNWAGLGAVQCVLRAQFRGQRLNDYSVDQICEQ